MCSPGRNNHLGVWRAAEKLMAHPVTALARVGVTFDRVEGRFIAPFSDVWQAQLLWFRFNQSLKFIFAFCKHVELAFLPQHTRSRV